MDLNTGQIFTGDIHGDVIVHGGESAPLTSLTLPWREAKATVPSMLSWRSRLTQLHAREGECESLRGWAHADFSTKRCP